MSRQYRYKPHYLPAEKQVETSNSAFHTPLPKTTKNIKTSTIQQSKPYQWTFPKNDSLKTIGAFAKYLTNSFFCWHVWILSDLVTWQLNIGPPSLADFYWGKNPGKEVLDHDDLWLWIHLNDTEMSHILALRNGKCWVNRDINRWGKGTVWAPLDVVALPRPETEKG